MSEKCDICKYSDIDHVVCCDMLLDKCIVCDFFKINGNDFEKMINNHIYLTNFADVKSYDNIPKNSKTYQKIKLMKNLFDFKNFNKYASEKSCNVCRETLLILKNKDLKEFKIYACPFCNSIYFDKKEFENAFNKSIKIVNRRSKIIRIIKKIIGLFKRH